MGCSDLKPKAAAAVGWGVVAALWCIGCAQLANIAEVSEGRTTSSSTFPRISGEWITWGGDPGNTRYSPLDQINALARFVMPELP